MAELPDQLVGLCQAAQAADWLNPEQRIVQWSFEGTHGPITLEMLPLGREQFRLDARDLDQLTAAEAEALPALAAQVPGVQVLWDPSSGEVRARALVHCRGARVTRQALQVALARLVRGENALSTALDGLARTAGEGSGLPLEEIGAAGNLEGMLLRLRALESESEIDLLMLDRRVTLSRRLLARLNKQRQPQLWAMVQTAQGQARCALYQLTEDDDHADAAEAAFGAALRTWTKLDEPAWWAALQVHLARHRAIRYSRSGQETYAQQAEAAFQEALRIFTEQENPSAWATLQSNLGTLHQARYMRGGPEEYAAQAEAAYRAALRILTKTEHAQHWHVLQGNWANLRTARAARRSAEESPSQVPRRSPAPGHRRSRKPRRGR